MSIIRTFVPTSGGTQLVSGTHAYLRRRTTFVRESKLSCRISLASAASVCCWNCLARSRCCCHPIVTSTLHNRFVNPEPPYSRATRNAHLHELYQAIIPS